MTNRISLVLCRAAAGASAAIYKGCGLQKANISPRPMGALLELTCRVTLKEDN